jgi:hypothetical protein
MPLGGQYCAACGQRVPRHDLTLGELLHEITHELFHWDGKLPKTLSALLLKPGLLTEDFLAGRRARWLPPLRLYLICSLAFFVSGALIETVTHRSANEVAKITIVNPDGTTVLTPEARQQIEQSLPGRIFGLERMERAAKNSARLNEVFIDAYPKAMFVLLPMFALLTSLAWNKKLPRYPAHLYPALHLHAAWFAALAIEELATAIPSTAVELTVGAALLVYMLLYGLLFLRRVFGDPWGITILKSAAIGCVYSCCLFAVSLGMLAYAVLSM